MELDSDEEQVFKKTKIETPKFVIPFQESKEEEQGEKIFYPSAIEKIRENALDDDELSTDDDEFEKELVLEIKSSSEHKVTSVRAEQVTTKKPTGQMSLREKFFGKGADQYDKIAPQKKAVKKGDWKIYPPSQTEYFIQNYDPIEELEELRLKLAQTTSKNEKCLILSQHPKLVKYWKYILHPFYHFQFSYERLEVELKSSSRTLTFYKSSGKIKNAKGEIFPYPRDIFDLLDLLREGSITGDIALETVLEFMYSFKKTAMRFLIARILDKNLKVGCNRNTVNAVFENLIPNFSVSRGEHLEKIPKKLFNPMFDEWYMSRKWDGIRTIVFLLDNKIEFLSRRGRSIGFCLKTLENYLIHLRTEEAKVGEKNFQGIILDVELVSLISGGNEDFRSVQISISRKQEATVTSFSTAHMMVLDVLTVEEFWAGTSISTFKYRYEHLQKIYNRANELLPRTKTYMTIVEQTKILNMAEIEKAKEISREKEWEGLMLRKNAPYIGKKSNDLLKVKEFIDHEFKCIDVEFGESTIQENGKVVHVTVMSNIIIDLGNGNTCSVGSGFDQEERIRYRDHPEEIKGKMVTIKYKKVSKNKKGGESLEFPVFKAIREGY
jgi:DNA ligase-1